MGAGLAGGVPKLKFEGYPGRAGEYRWRLKAGNGAVLAALGQGYKDKAAAQHGAEPVWTTGADPKMGFEVCEDARKEHRWWP